MIRLTMLTGLIFSAWITYHFVKPALQGILVSFP